MITRRNIDPGASTSFNNIVMIGAD